jgi:UDP-3-O-[3-hydroxymyristoyl] glucosamine N-acyltransferase
MGKMLHAPVVGPDCLINSLGWADTVSAYDSQLSFATSEKYLKRAVQNGKIKALIVNEDLVRHWQQGGYHRDLSFIITEQPMASFYLLHNLLFETTNFYDVKSPQSIGKNCSIHPNAFIDEGVIIGNNVTVGPYTSILSGTVIKDNVHVESNCVIGEAGFQIVEIEGKLETVSHIGGVLIEEGARIKSFCNVDKELFEGYTLIGPGTCVDTHVCISHGTHIGRNCMIGRCSNLCGNVHLGDYVWIAPSVTVGFRVKVGRRVRINIGSVVVSNVREGEEISGYYGMPHQSWMMKYKDELKEYVFQQR